MKTTLQKLIDYIEEFQPKNKTTDGIWNKAKSLIEEEKEHIKQSYKDGVVQKAEGANQYYNSKFTTL